MMRLPISATGTNPISVYECQGTGPVAGNASGAPMTPSSTASNPADPEPQCVVAATAANSGANGAPEKNGQVNRVTAMAAAVVRTAIRYGR